MGPYLLVFLVAAAIVLVVTPGVLWLSKKIGAIDIPDDRKVHAAPTPSMGGVAIYLGLLGSMFVASNIEPFASSFVPLVIWPPSEPVAIIGAATIIHLLGVVDDIRGLRAPVKFAGQVIAAGMVFLAGVRLEFLRFPIGTDAVVLSPDLSAIATITWIVLIVNAVNLLDGLDGLAAGITAIAAATFFIYTYQLTLGLSAEEVLERNAPLISVIIVGTAIGFLRYNFNPARIFMGDSGAYLLGFLLSVATVIGVGRSAQNPVPEALLFYLPLLIPLTVLAVPLLDTIFAVVRRARARRHLFQADKHHLHHRLLEIGHGHRQAVLVLYGWTATMAGLALAFSFQPSVILRWVFVAAAIALILYALLPGLLRGRA